MTWWNNSWSYKKQITLTADTGQISYLATIPYNSHMNSDFSDIRFANSAETIELNYTIESYNSTDAIVRVYSQGATSFYMYYGNPTATTKSSASDAYFNPISYYYLDGNTNDAVGTNDGTNHGATVTTGKIGQGYNFDGNSHYINFGHAFDSLSADATFSFWMKSVGTQDTYSTVLTRGKWGNNGAMSFRKDGSSNKIIFEIYNAGTHPTSTTEVYDGNWHLISGVISGTNTYLYVDGNLEDTQSLPSGWGTMSSETWIGANTAGTRYFNGKIDEVGIWNKALTQSEITTLYQQTAPTFTIGAEQENHSSFTKEGIARIQFQKNLTKQGNSRIKIIDLQNVYDANARIKKALEFTKIGISSVKKTLEFTKTGNAILSQRHSFDKIGKTRVNIPNSFEKTGNAYVLNGGIFNKIGTSRILIKNLFQKEANSQIKKTLEFTKIGTSRINKQEVFNKIGNASITNHRKIIKSGKSFLRIIDSFKPKIEVSQNIKPQIRAIETFN